MQYFPDRLKAARKMNGLSLQELSEKLNNTISKQDLNRLETGVMQPDSKLLSVLTNVLQVTNDYFFKKQTIALEQVEFRKLTSLPKKERSFLKREFLNSLVNNFAFLVPLALSVNLSLMYGGIIHWIG